MTRPTSRKIASDVSLKCETLASTSGPSRSIRKASTASRGCGT